MCESKRQTTPPPADNIQILAADLLCHHAAELLRQLAHSGWEPAVKLQEAVELYSEVRIGVSMAEGADAVLRAIDETDPQKVNVADWPPAPETERSSSRV